MCSDPGENHLPAGGPQWWPWLKSKIITFKKKTRVTEPSLVHSGDPTGVGGAVDVGKDGADNIGSRSFPTAATADRRF